MTSTEMTRDAEVHIVWQVSMEDWPVQALLFNTFLFHNLSCLPLANRAEQMQPHQRLQLLRPNCRALISEIVSNELSAHSTKAVCRYWLMVSQQLWEWVLTILCSWINMIGNMMELLVGAVCRVRACTLSWMRRTSLWSIRRIWACSTCNRYSRYACGESAVTMAGWRLSSFEFLHFVLSFE